MRLHIDSPEGKWCYLVLSLVVDPLGVLWIADIPGTSYFETYGIDSSVCNNVLLSNHRLFPHLRPDLARFSALPSPNSLRWTPPVLHIYLVRPRLWFPEAGPRKKQKQVFMLLRSRQLVRELDITGGDDAAVGYYAGLIVCIEITYLQELLTVCYDCRSLCSLSRKC